MTETAGRHSLFDRWRLWRRRCSTCGQRMTAPACSRSPETGKGFHTVTGGCAAKETDSP